MQERITNIGRRIAAVSDRPNLPYTFKVLDVDEVNAMALLGGFVYTNKYPYGSLIGLMKLAELNLDIKNDLFSDHPEVTERIRFIQQYFRRTTYLSNCYRIYK